MVNALPNSPWGVFTMGSTVPIALIMGFWMFKSHAGKITVTGPSIFGVVLLLTALIAGHWFAQIGAAGALTFTPHQITILMAIYGFIASVLPVWLVLEPRDYLSTYVKLGTIAVLVIGVFVVHPNIQFPNFTTFVHGGGPIIKGKLFPFLFVTIACGAISGFHALVSSGTTPKMLDKECDARFIGYGAMVAESLVGVLALIAACSMYPGDYFAMNTTPAVFSHLGLTTVNLDMYSREVGEKLAGRTGGAVSLAIGMAGIFRGLPGMDRLMGYWYHYAIMFEALFILTTVDTGTRVARYVLQELMGKVHKPFGNNAWLPGNLITSSLVVLGWGYLIYTGNISTIWPMFGIGNQLLATIALAVTTTFLINMGKREICVDYGTSDVLRGCHDGYGGSAGDQRYFLAVDRQAGAAIYRLSGYNPREHLCRGRSSGCNRCGAALDPDFEWCACTAGGLRSSAYRCWRSEDGVLLRKGANRQALKRGRIYRGLVARVGLVPFPFVEKSEFSRKL